MPGSLPRRGARATVSRYNMTMMIVQDATVEEGEKAPGLGCDNMTMMIVQFKNSKTDFGAFTYLSMHVPFDRFIVPWSSTLVP